MKKLRRFLSLLKKTGLAWSRDKAWQLAAALAYYTLFSLAPMLIIVTSIAGWVIGDQAVLDEVILQLQYIVGASTATLVETMLLQAVDPESTNLITTIIGIVTLWWAASNLFGQLQQILNTFWGVETRSQIKGVWGFIWARLLAVLMVIVMGFLLLLSLITLSFVSAMRDVLLLLAPQVVELLPLIDLGVSIFILTLIFMVIYKALPNIPLDWRDVMVGALFTAVLFAGGKYLIVWYLGQVDLQTAYGVAGSLVVLLVWVYYSAQIFLFGAAFTKVFAVTYGSQQERVGKMPAIHHLVSSAQENPWPTLERVTNPKPRKPPQAKSQWWWQAIIAFVLGLFVGTKRGS